MRFPTTGAALAAARALGWSSLVSGNTHDAADVGIPMASPDARISIAEPIVEPSSGRHRKLGWELNYLRVDAEVAPGVDEMIKVEYEVGKDRTVVSQLLHHDCDPSRPITGLEYTYRPNTRPKDDSLNYFTAAYAIVKTSLANSSIWTPPDASVNSTLATIEFCHVLQLTAPWPAVEGQPARDDLVIAEHKKPFTLNVDFLGDFSFGVGAEIPRLRMTIFADVELSVPIYNYNQESANIRSYYTEATTDVLNRGLTDARELISVYVTNVGGGGPVKTTWRTRFIVEELCYNDTTACDNLRSNWTMFDDIGNHMLGTHYNGTWTQRLQEVVAYRTNQQLLPPAGWTPPDYGDSNLSFNDRKLSAPRALAVPEMVHPRAPGAPKDGPGALRGATTPREDLFMEAVAGARYGGAHRQLCQRRPPPPPYVPLKPYEYRVLGPNFPVVLPPPIPPIDPDSPDYECRFDPNCPEYRCENDPNRPDCYNPNEPPPDEPDDNRDDPSSPDYDPGWRYPDPRSDPSHPLYECRYDPECPEYDPHWDPYNHASRYRPFPHGLGPNCTYTSGERQSCADGYDPRMDPTHGDYDPTLDPNSDNFNPPWLNPTDTSDPEYDPRYDENDDYYECWLDPSCDEYEPTVDPSNPTYIPQRDPRRPSYDCRNDPQCPDYQCRFDRFCPDYDTDDDPYNNPGSSWHPQPHGDPYGNPDSYRPELDPNSGQYDPTQDPYHPSFVPPTDPNDQNFCRYNPSCPNYDCTFDPTSSGDCTEDPYREEADPMNPCYDSRFDLFGPYEPRKHVNHTDYDPRYDPTATDPIYNPVIDPYHCRSRYHPFPHGNPNGDPAGYDTRMDPNHANYDETLDPNSENFSPPGSGEQGYDPRYDETDPDYECYLDPSCGNYDPRLDPSNPAYESRMDPRRSDYHDPRMDPNHRYYDPRFDPIDDNYTVAIDPYNRTSRYHPFPHGDSNIPDGYDSRMDPDHGDYDETLDPNSDNFSPPGSGEQGYDPRYDSEDPYYRPEFDPSHDDYDPRLDPSNPNYNPRMDPRHPLYERRYDPNHVLYDARFDPFSPFYDNRLDRNSWGYDEDNFNTTAPGYDPSNDPTHTDYDPRSDDQHPYYDVRRDPNHNNYNPEMDPYNDNFNPPEDPSDTSHPNYDPRFDPNSPRVRFGPLNHLTPFYDPRFDTNATGYDPRMDPTNDAYVPEIDPMRPEYNPLFDPTQGDNGQVDVIEPEEPDIVDEDPSTTFGAINATQDFSELVTACKCDAAVPFTCTDDVLFPNGALSVCIKSLSPYVLISELSNMRIQQGSDVNLPVISNDVVNIPDITGREYVSSENGVAVTTRVPPNVFTFAQGESIVVSGDIVLRLAGSERRRLKVNLEAVGVKNTEEGSGRNLQALGGNAGFEIIVDLEEGEDMVTVATVNAAAGRTNGGLVVLGTMIFSYAFVMM